MRTRSARIGSGPASGGADLFVLRRDDELVELLRRRGNVSPQDDRVARLFTALLAEIDGGLSPVVRRVAGERR